MGTGKKIVIDLETTGLKKEIEDVLQVSIIDEDFNVLMNEYFRPEKKKSWGEAEKINHISPVMVADKRTLKEAEAEITKILYDAEEVIGFNHIYFDIPFLENKFNKSLCIKQYDVMIEFSKHFIKNPNKYHRISLNECCEKTGVVNEKAHDSLGDTVATLKVYKWMQENLYKAGHPMFEKKS